MNKQTIRVMAAVLLVIATAGCKKPARSIGATVPANFVAHTGGDFTFKTPSTWKVKEAGIEHVLLNMVADDGVTNVNVAMVAEVLPTRDPDDVAKQVEAGVKTKVQSFTLKTAESILVAGEDAPRIIYEASAMGFAFRGQQTYVVHKGKTYIVTFTVPVSSYDKFAPIFDQMLESIQIK